MIKLIQDYNAGEEPVRVCIVIVSVAGDGEFVEFPLNLSSVMGKWRMQICRELRSNGGETIITVM